MPQIVEMMTKKNFPLLMCSEDDGYNPLLLKSIQFYHQDTKDRLVVPPHIKLNVTYDSYHRKTVSWMVDIERRNCKLIISTLYFNYQLKPTIVKYFINISTNSTLNKLVLFL